MTIRISFSDKTVRVAVEINGVIESKITELPQRPWVGLTDEEYQQILIQHDGAGLLAFYNLVEAKLKEKNT